MQSQPQQAKTQTMVREYKSTGAYEHDAKKLARDGWSVQSVTERRPNIGCMRGCLLGLMALVWRPKPILVVTYTRTA